MSNTTSLWGTATPSPTPKKILPGKENVAWNVLLIKIFCLSSKFKHQDLLYGTRFLGCWSISSAYQYKAQLSYKVLAEQHKMRICLICVLSAFLWFCHEPISDTHIWGRLEVTQTPPEHLYLSYVTRTESFDNIIALPCIEGPPGLKETCPGFSVALL